MMTSPQSDLSHSDCIFCKIINHQASAEIIYQDELVTAFENIRPVTPVHILIVPNQHITSVNETTAADEAALGRLITLAGRLAKERGIDQSGYRLVINTGKDGGQSVYHLHLHLIGGRHLGFQI